MTLETKVRFLPIVLHLGEININTNTKIITQVDSDGNLHSYVCDKAGVGIVLSKLMKDLILSKRTPLLDTDSVVYKDRNDYCIKTVGLTYNDITRLDSKVLRHIKFGKHSSSCIEDLTRYIDNRVSDSKVPSINKELHYKLVWAVEHNNTSILSKFVPKFNEYVNDFMLDCSKYGRGIKIVTPKETHLNTVENAVSWTKSDQDEMIRSITS